MAMFLKKSSLRVGAGCNADLGRTRWYHISQGDDIYVNATRNLLPSFATQNPPPSRREAIGRSKPLPYRHIVPYPPHGGISSRQRLVYHHTSVCISSPLPQLILPRKINFTCAFHKPHPSLTHLTRLSSCGSEGPSLSGRIFLYRARSPR